LIYSLNQLVLKNYTYGGSDTKKVHSSLEVMHFSHDTNAV